MARRMIPPAGVLVGNGYAGATIYVQPSVGYAVVDDVHAPSLLAQGWSDATPGTGGSPTTVPFSTTVPLDGNKLMAPTTVTGPLTFSAGTLAPGGYCAVTLIADGSNAPNLSAFSRWAADFGYSNNAGDENLIEFSVSNGRACYQISQPAVQGALPDTTPPTVASAQVANASPMVIAITFNEALSAGNVPATSAFAVSGGKTVSSVGISGSTVNVTVNAAYANGDTITVSYTQPGSSALQDASGNKVASFTNQAVTNNVGAAASFVAAHFTGGSALVEQADTPSAGDVTLAFTAGTAPSTYGTTGMGVSTVGLVGGTDGEVRTTIDASQTGTSGNIGMPAFGVKESASAPATSTYTTWMGQVLINTTSGNYSYSIGNGAVQNTSTAAQTGDIVRVSRVGTTVKAQVARSATPATWVDIATFSSASSGKLWGLVDASAAARKLFKVQVSSAWA